MVAIDKVEAGIARYIDRELIPQLPCDGLKGFGIGVAASLLLQKLGVILRQYAGNPMLKTLEIVNDDGMVDIEVLHEAIRRNVQENGLAIDLPLVGGIKLYKADVDTIYRMIKEA